MPKELKLGLSMWRMGYHVAAWRHPEVDPRGSMTFAHFLEVVEIATEGLFDLVFMPDELAIRGSDNPPGAQARQSASAELEPITLLAALAPATRNIGLVSTGSTTYSEPYNLARQMLSLDHLSGGRAGWNVVTSWGKEDALNFGHLAPPDYAMRYDRAAEFVEVVRALWRSWDADAFIRDKDSGVFYDPAKGHLADHHGPHFTVRGPLHMERSPQDEPVIVSAGDSDQGRDLAARSADIVFTAKQDIEDARDFQADIKRRAVGFGRDADHVVVMPGLMPIVAQTQAAAEAKFEEIQSLIDPTVGLAALYDRLGDLSDYPIDGPVPEPRDPAFRSRAETIYRFAQREGLTIRELYRLQAAGRGHRVLVGTPERIADEMQLWLESGAADGFNIAPTHLPAGIRDFVDMVVPELQRRGLFRHDYAGSTLRANLGLPPVKPA